MFRVPTEATEMTPERFHDFLSLASSPPLPSSFPPRPLPSTPPGRHSLTEQERGVLANDGGGSTHEPSVESDSLQSAPSFAQVGKLAICSEPFLSSTPLRSLKLGVS